MTGTIAPSAGPTPCSNGDGVPPTKTKRERPEGDSHEALSAALQQAHWRRLTGLSSGLEWLERFIAGAGFARGPWLAVAFGCGIAAWFALPGRWEWLILLACTLGTAAAAASALRSDGQYPWLRQAVCGMSLALAAGCGTAWTKSELVGTPGITAPIAATFTGVVVSRDEQPAEGRTRLIIAIRDPANPARIIRVRVNVATDNDHAEAREGALVSLRARLMPPAAPMLPGSYDFARAAWFGRLAATGSALGPVSLVRRSEGSGELLAGVRRALSRHVRARLSGSAGGIAAAFASGDRGGIAEIDEEAMRDSGLTHLLSVSGLHVSAVIGAVYVLALRLLALWPWLALRFRLPLVAAGCAAFSGVFYTLLTGAEVPTVRSSVGALLVLAAVALGREALSLRLLAAAGFAVMLLWPESVVGPSFQLSFGAVLAIVAVHGAAPMRAFTAYRPEPWWAATLRHLAVLLVTGIVIELALMPIGLFHFHRAGVYGSIANVIAIPLTTFVTMPLIALALFLDLASAGAPAWWAVGKSLQFLLWLAHFVAGQPGAVTMFPQMGTAAYALFLSGGIWLALWHGRRRLWGLVPVAVGTIGLAVLQPPDVLVSGDGRHVGFTGLAPNALVMLRDTKKGFARDNLTESAGLNGTTIPLDEWPGARCNDDFCGLDIVRGGRTWKFLLARGNNPVALGELAAACEKADVVIADRRLPWSCRPMVLKADRTMLDQSGGLALDLEDGSAKTVAAMQGQHGWWRPRERPKFKPRPDGAEFRSPPTSAGTQSPSAISQGATIAASTSPGPKGPRLSSTGQ